MTQTKSPFDDLTYMPFYVIALRGGYVSGLLGNVTASRDDAMKIYNRPDAIRCIRQFGGTLELCPAARRRA